MFTNEQRSILKASGTQPHHLSEVKIFDIARRNVDESTLSDEELLEFIEIANALYRGGGQIISDAEYDLTFLAELRSRNPHHPYLAKVEPEQAFEGKTVELPTRMLSTEKAYTFEEIKRWAKRIEKVSIESKNDFHSLVFRVTPKLDGFAAFDDGVRLYTRGDGRRGTDISRVFDRGLQVAQNAQRGLGAGEIVVSRSYFQERLSDYFENPRNFQASIIKEKELEVHAAEAISEGAAVFYPFAILPHWEGAWKELETHFDSIIERMWSSVDYDIDGVVLEITDQNLKVRMGATRHHYRWQIAFKQNTEKAQVKVLRVVPQTSRSGRVNPVAEVEPTRLSGALIQRATAHHYKMVQERGIGPGAVIELARSGEVIPKIEGIVSAVEPQLPNACPSCGAELVWEKDYLLCTNNMECPAQITTSIEHFFKTLANIDGFGPATIKVLYENEIRTIDRIYQLRAQEFEAMGFGPKQSTNLVEQLRRSRAEQIEDWRFLAAFGVYRLGLGNCEKLLSVYPLQEVFSLTESDIIAVEGFAEKTAQAVQAGLKRIEPLFRSMYDMGFNLVATPLAADSVDSETSSPIAGKLIVFTGTMLSKSRDEMKKEAKALGAKVGSSVTGKTDYLVTGEKVGATKTDAARQKGVQVITEREYLQLIEKG